MSRSRRHRGASFIAAALVLLCYTLFISGGGITGSFLRLNKERTLQIQTGEWQGGLPSSLKSYIENLSATLPTPEGTEKSLTNYLLSVMFKNLSPLEIRQTFSDYSLPELKQTVQSVVNYAQNSLTVSGNEVVFLPYTSAKSITAEFGSGLKSGEHAFYHHVLCTAEFAASPYYSPVAVYISLEGETDLTDFSLEILFDKNTFSDSEPFSYNYRYIDTISWTINRAQGSLSANNNNLLSISKTAQNSYVTRAFVLQNGKYSQKTFNHAYGYPNLSGNWCRLSKGANLILSQPKGSEYGNVQQFDPHGNGERQGMILPGRPDGRKIELRLDLPIRKPKSGSVLPCIPITLVLSRAAGSSQTPIQPTVKMKFISGTVWAE